MQQVERILHALSNLKLIVFIRIINYHIPQQTHLSKRSCEGSTRTFHTNGFFVCWFIFSILSASYNGNKLKLISTICAQVVQMRFALLPYPLRLVRLLLGSYALNICTPIEIAPTISTLRQLWNAIRFEGWDEVGGGEDSHANSYQLYIFVNRALVSRWKITMTLISW